MKNTLVTNKIEYIVKQGDGIIYYKGDNRIRAYSISDMLDDEGIPNQLVKETTETTIEVLKGNEG